MTVEIFAHIDRVQREGGTQRQGAWSAGGQMTPGSKPEDTMSSSSPALDLMTAESRRRSLPSVAHVLATESVRRGALARFDSLEHCAFFERHGRRPDQPATTRTRWPPVLRDSGSAMMANLSTAMPWLERAARPARQRTAVAEPTRLAPVRQDDRSISASAAATSA
jgi:hypothetical protein